MLLNVKGLQDGRSFVLGTFESRDSELARDEAEACAEANGSEFEDITIVDAATGDVLYENEQWKKAQDR